LIGGETTVSLGPNPGKGGRNQEFVLALLHKLGLDAGNRVWVLSAGTDGEDGPTDAAGASGGIELLQAAARLGLQPADYLRRHDAYSFFEQTGGLVHTGLTGTNVMDIRIILIW
jgi:hydroxypyruvate reductase/glycerate 2-kinase